jgi:hypothetical protein
VTVRAVRMVREVHAVLVRRVHAVPGVLVRKVRRHTLLGDAPSGSARLYFASAFAIACSASGAMRA